MTHRGGRALGGGAVAEVRAAARAAEAEAE